MGRKQAIRASTCERRRRRASNPQSRVAEPIDRLRVRALGQGPSDIPAAEAVEHRRGGAEAAGRGHAARRRSDASRVGWCGSASATPRRPKPVSRALARHGCGIRPHTPRTRARAAIGKAAQSALMNRTIPTRSLVSRANHVSRAQTSRSSLDGRFSRPNRARSSRSVIIRSGPAVGGLTSRRPSTRSTSDPFRDGLARRFELASEVGRIAPGTDPLDHLPAKRNGVSRTGSGPRANTSREHLARRRPRCPPDWGNPDPARGL
jgi:hypothetical protein